MIKQETQPQIDEPKPHWQEHLEKDLDPVSRPNGWNVDLGKRVSLSEIKLPSNNAEANAKIPTWDEALTRYGQAREVAVLKIQEYQKLGLTARDYASPYRGHLTACADSISRQVQPAVQERETDIEFRSALEAVISDMRDDNQVHLPERKVAFGDPLPFTESEAREYAKFIKRVRRKQKKISLLKNLLNQARTKVKSPQRVKSIETHIERVDKAKEWIENFGIPAYLTTAQNIRTVNQRVKSTTALAELSGKFRDESYDADSKLVRDRKPAKKFFLSERGTPHEAQFVDRWKALRAAETELIEAISVNRNVLGINTAIQNISKAISHFVLYEDPLEGELKNYAFLVSGLGTGIIERIVARVIEIGPGNVIPLEVTSPLNSGFDVKKHPPKLQFDKDGNLLTAEDGLPLITRDAFITYSTPTFETELEMFTAGQLRPFDNKMNKDYTVG